VRIVADTNVYISALNFGGSSEEVLAHAKARAVQLFVSPSILKEVEGVLVHKFEWSTARARQATDAIQEFADLVQPQEAIAVIPEDEPDNRILECAVEAKADVLVSGDRHLRNLKAFRGTRILSPGEFLQNFLREG
jgi:putative PIN family toxin of toxin-antitoxin system